MESKRMSIDQFNKFIKFLDITKKEFADKYALKIRSVYHYTRQCRKIAESVAKSKKYEY